MARWDGLDYWGLTVSVAECRSAKDLYRAAEDAHFYNSVPYFDLTQPSNQRNISGNHSHLSRGY